MPLVEVGLALLVEQHPSSSLPQLVQVCFATWVFAFPCPTTSSVVAQPSHWCRITGLVGRPPAIRICPPLALQSGTCVTTSLHFWQDIGLKSDFSGTGAGRPIRISRVAPFSMSAARRPVAAKSTRTHAAPSARRWLVVIAVLVFIRCVFRFVGLLNPPPLTLAGVGECAETSPAKSRVVERCFSCRSQNAYGLEAETPQQFRPASLFACGRILPSFPGDGFTWLSACNTGREGVRLAAPY